MHLKDLSRKRVSQLNDSDALDLIVSIRTKRLKSTIGTQKKLDKEVDKLNKELEALLEQLPPSERERVLKKVHSPQSEGVSTSSPLTALAD